jgi:hypothetical protein
VFGVHQVFHAITIVGASPHFVAETRFVRDDAARVCVEHAGHGVLDALASSVAAH